MIIGWFNWEPLYLDGTQNMDDASHKFSEYPICDFTNEVPYLKTNELVSAGD